MKNIIRTPETHPLTWRLRDDKQPVWLDEYRSKNGYEGRAEDARELEKGIVRDLPVHHDFASVRQGVIPGGVRWSPDGFQRKKRCCRIRGR